MARDPQLLRSVREAAQRAGSLEDALRAALQRICAATGWQAGRVEFAQGANDDPPRTVWYLEQPDRLDTLKSVAERRRRSNGGGDRKSTRLNSSHVSISYAVFCLKK